MLNSEQLISTRQGKLAWIKVIGFVLLFIGLGELVIFSALGSDTTQKFNIPSIMSVSFFIIMLGFVFVFPDLLKDQNKSLSTMRITVFMMTNVICMLLLKIGWSDNITSLRAIGLDEWWMGVIAFIFGAKATQAYFESKMAIATAALRSKEEPPRDETPVAPRNITITGGHEMARQAILQNEASLRSTCPNIVQIMPSYCLEGNDRTPCVDICISDNAKEKIPTSLNYTGSDGVVRQIRTQVLTNYDNVKPQAGRGDLIASRNFLDCYGTIACSLKNNNTNEVYFLTCNHVLTGGVFENSFDENNIAVEFFRDNVYDIGSWKNGKMDNTIDAALIKADDAVDVETNNIKLPLYFSSEDDCSKTLVFLTGGMSGKQSAYIIHINQTVPVEYDDKVINMDDLITISGSLNINNYTPVTQKGDSGAMVYHSNTLQPIGMVVGANSHFTFVIPMKTILNAFPSLYLSINS